MFYSPYPIMMPFIQYPMIQQDQFAGQQWNTNTFSPFFFYQQENMLQNRIQDQYKTVQEIRNLAQEQIGRIETIIKEQKLTQKLHLNLKKKIKDKSINNIEDNIF